MGKRVLLVDADPQCSLTAYVIDGEVLDDLLDHSDDKDGATLWSAVKPIIEATGNLREIEPIDLSEGRLAPSFQRSPYVYVGGTFRRGAK